MGLVAFAAIEILFQDFPHLDEHLPAPLIVEILPVTGRG